MRVVQYLEAMVREWTVIQSEGYTDTTEESPLVFRYMLNKGRHFESAQLTTEEAEWVSALDWRSHQPRQCYRNAQVVALNMEVPDGMKLYYVEGYVVPGRDFPFPVEHAWLSLNGKVIDTTLLFPDIDDRRIFGEIPSDWEYFGVEIDVYRCNHIFWHMVHISLLNDAQCGWPLLKWA